MIRRDEPIIKSRTDVDFYKPNMQQLYHKLHGKVPARFAFTNRSKDIPLGYILDIGQLREELDHVRSLLHTEVEIAYYRGLGIYSEDFLSYLETQRLPELDVRNDDGTLVIETDVGPLPEVSPWETLVLSVVNELYYRQVIKENGLDSAAGLKSIEQEGERRLMDKIALLRAEDSVKFIEFGTRRRKDRLHQRRMLQIMQNELPDMLLGTSNVALAREFGLDPKGTNAHELYSAYACIYGDTDENLRGSQHQVLEDWERLYGPELLIALPDTFGTEFFFRDFDPAQSGRWSGVRQDSGDPVEFAERTIAHYRKWGIDPREKTIIFSDGLNVGQIQRIDKAVGGRINAVYGWGTDLTNDVGFRTLSLVMKLVMAAWRYAVKLSDNPAKHMGPKAEVERAKRVFQYYGGLYVPLHS